ncbi:putative PEP-binding protein [Streptomyces sp. NPDC058685]|uniref:putative PEP-binding protein n=1 Tax=Streptomyces sp. NPDC058685 TaxID=3346598 RepID=UPI0036603C72
MRGRRRVWSNGGGLVLVSSATMRAARLLAGHDTSHALRAAAGRALASAGATPVGTGTGVTQECASGVLCTTPAQCASATQAGTPYVYARPVTNAVDMPAAADAVALFTASGGTTSHAAVLARSWEKPTVVGTAFTLNRGTLTMPGGGTLRSGEWVTVCATTGTVWRGRLERYEDPRARDLVRELSEAAEVLGDLPGPVVYANADTLAEAERCMTLGAAGVGVARSEHMFFDVQELPHLRAALWADQADGREAALAKLRTGLVNKCRALMSGCSGKKLAIRLLDPPAHEFAAPEDLPRLREHNPMMGVRGSRLGVLRPDLYRTQAQAIVEAHLGLPPAQRSRLAILLPFLTTGAETRAVRRTLALPARAAAEVTVGAMIETPEAVFRAADIAAEVDYLSVGTNDLVQFSLGMSRDDVAAALLPAYLSGKLLDDDPMAHLDHSLGTMGLIQILSQTVPDTPWGVCGEHAADPPSLAALLPCGPAFVSVSAAGVLPARIEVGRYRARTLLEHDE